MKRIRRDTNISILYLNISIIMYQNVPIELIERIEALERRMEKIEKETPSNLPQDPYPLRGLPLEEGRMEALQTSRTNYSKRTLLGGCRTAEPKSASSLTSTLTLRELMECKAPDGSYLMRTTITGAAH